MPHASRNAVAQWREADARAREAEISLTAARYEYLSGDGPEPSIVLQAEARLLRKLADAKLKAAIATLGGGTNL